MRTFGGKVLLRLPPTVHEDLARESFETGRSINQLCMEAILVRKALKRYDPWKGIEALWSRQKRVDPAKLARDIEKAIREVRETKRRGRT